MLLALRNVKKSFGAVTAVKDVSLSMRQGEVLGIMGPNGAGKTTLFNLIMQEMKIDSGSIEFLQKPLMGAAPDQVTRMGIGRTYQIPQPFRQMTVLENVMVGELFRSKGGTVAEARENAMIILEKVGMRSRAEVKASALGLLELKRLELARALSTRPQLLLLDEIAGGLVDSEVEVLKEILLGLKAEGLSMLMIEHVLALLFELSDRLLVVHFGESIVEGEPQAVINNPQVVEAYLGSTEWKEEPAIEVAQVPCEPIRAKAPPLLTVDRISASYGEFQALFEVELDIAEREIVGLIGLNGAGKTTLIRALTRLLPITKGSVHFKGQRLDEVKPHEVVELGIAQSIEGRKIFPELTVLENLQLGAYSARARANRKESLDRVFSLFPILAERKHQLGTTMSGGQQQMLAIGRALMAMPELLICDEISLGLAPIVIDQLYDAIREINRQGTAILLVEQSVERALRTVDRAFVIESGRIVLSGSARELKNQPEFINRYFGVATHP
ncbi:ATP-binding cassette domain-containing protein [Brevibacillus fluminis]|uniref:ATP-binding cassette domain-containing protein n=1 Tax=Brevibacillus fluminis TaxID=511487 RepID=UPI003F887514